MKIIYYLTIKIDNDHKLKKLYLKVNLKTKKYSNIQ